MKRKCFDSEYPFDRQKSFILGNRILLCKSLLFTFNRFPLELVFIDKECDFYPSIKYFYSDYNLILIKKTAVWWKLVQHEVHLLQGSSGGSRLAPEVCRFSLGGWGWMFRHMQWATCDQSHFHFTKLVWSQLRVAKKKHVTPRLVTVFLSKLCLLTLYSCFLTKYLKYNINSCVKLWFTSFTLYTFILYRPAWFYNVLFVLFMSNLQSLFYSNLKGIWIKWIMMKKNY